MNCAVTLIPRQACTCLALFWDQQKHFRSILFEHWLGFKMNISWCLLRSWLVVPHLTRSQNGWTEDICTRGFLSKPLPLYWLRYQKLGFSTERAETVSQKCMRYCNGLFIYWNGIGHIDPFLPQLCEMIIRHYDDLWSTGTLTEVLWNFMSQIRLSVCQACGEDWAKSFGQSWTRQILEFLGQRMQRMKPMDKNECTDSMVATKQSSAMAHSWQYNNAWQWQLCYFSCNYFVHLCSRILVYFFSLSIIALDSSLILSFLQCPSRCTWQNSSRSGYIGFHWALDGVETEPITSNPPNPKPKHVSAFCELWVWSHN